MIEFEINGKKIEAAEGTMIIEAADAAGIYIPRFCYHRKLSIVANCRMCLVEVSNMRKPVPACATPITPDLKVFTLSESALEAQRAVMSFLLINHPLDCPICDQGGECELQDIAVGFGRSHSYYNEPKRAVKSEDIGPLIATEMTRCIHCTRCVRFGEEVAGLREMGVTFRGEHSEIGPYIQHFLTSELSGNIIDLCPVGALTSKPARYTERAWELKEHRGVAPHDCVGSNIYFNTRGYEYTQERKVMRVNPRDSESINECWISDRDRFAYEGLNSPDRLLKPRMKKNGQWVDVDWEYALMAIADRLSAIVHHQSPDQISALISPNSTLEEAFIMQKFIRGLGSPHIDHRLRERDFSDQDRLPVSPTLGIKISEIDDLDAILLIGSRVRYEQPLLAHRINKAYQEGATVMVLNPIDEAFTFSVKHRLINADLVQKTREIVKALADHRGKTIAMLSDVDPSDDAKQIAMVLMNAQKSYVMLGNVAMQHAQASELRELHRFIAELSDSRYGVVTDGANGAGAWLAGAVPHRGVASDTIELKGHDAKTLLTTKPVRAYFLLNAEPEYDTAYPNAALNALNDASCVVSISSFSSPMMEQYSDFMLPATAFGEQAGTFVNAEGTWQTFAAVSIPHGESRPAWKIIHALANIMELSGFHYESSSDLHHAVKKVIDQLPQKLMEHPVELLSSSLVNRPLLLALPHAYRVDALVRRAPALQACLTETDAAVRMNQVTAEGLGVSSGTLILLTIGHHEIHAPVFLDPRVADDVVVAPFAIDSITIGEITCS